MKNFLCLLILIIVPALLTAQDKQLPIDIFEDANYYRFNEEYQEALPLYQKLVGMGYNHEHMYYVLGRTYMHISGQKDKAIPYLRKSTKRMSEDISEGGGLLKSRAPKDALFYLGKAYQIHNELDSALHCYQAFLDTLENKQNYNLDFVYQQIETAKKAQELINNPVPVTSENLGDTINDAFSNTKPIVDAGENKLVYTARLKFYDAMFMSEKKNGQWSGPVNLAPQIRSEGNLYPCDMNNDGTKMILFRQERSRGDLYISQWDEQKQEWQIPEEPRGKINSRQWETHGCFGPGDKTLYFTSNRRGGQGGLDIYVSYYNDDRDRWSDPVNLGETINTPYNEATPFISEDGNKLYFSSQGHESMGGFDIFVSEKNGNGEWSEPTNMGYPISTTDDDRFFQPVQNGRAAYFSKFSKQGHGGEDIYRMEIHLKD